MLSRVADSLYWMSRYLERAEHIARLIDVQLNLMLDQSVLTSEQRWRHLLRCLGAKQKANKLEELDISRALTFEGSSDTSIVNCVNEARENARQVREQISSEMWEQINRLFHEVKRAGSQRDWDTQPLEFLQTLREQTHLFQGISDSTMSHGEGWHFIQLGRFIERANNTAILLDAHFAEAARYPPLESAAEAHLEWIGLLKSCTAFEAYCKVYTADIQSIRIAEFLLLDAEFPHSIRFSIDMVNDGLNAIAHVSPARNPERIHRLTGRLRSSLRFSQIDEILTGGLHPYLESIEKQCNHIHSAIHQIYINYPVQSALEA